MPFALTTGQYNVKATLYAWLAVQIAAYKPDGITTALVVVDFPEQPLTAPVWSLSWLGTIPDAPYQGGNVGSGQYGGAHTGMLEINCWVTLRMTNWSGLLDQMSDTLLKAVAANKANGSAVVIRDFYTSATAPAETAYRVTLGELDARTPPYDPNPDIKRRRFILPVRWIVRG